MALFLTWQGIVTLLSAGTVSILSYKAIYSNTDDVGISIVASNASIKPWFETTMLNVAKLPSGGISMGDVSIVTTGFGTFVLYLVFRVTP